MEEYSLLVVDDDQAISAAIAIYLKNEGLHVYQAKDGLGGTLDELFDRFKRGDASRYTEGSGLGLAIAQSIIERHGGRFTINLDGDLFKIQFYLPLAM